MRLPPFERYIRGMQLAGVFILGMLAGAVLLNSLFVAQFEALYHTKNELESKLEQYEQDIRGLNQYKNQHTVIKSIQLRLAENNGKRTHLDKVTEAELIKRVKEDLSIFLGQSIYEVDSDAKFARKILERKVYEDINGKDYVVELQTVLLADNVLQIWMIALPHAKAPAS
ncbi:hypothetical protein D3P07_03325 [Paenibacillus sp. 1011MAR3C5]|uniref:hypothetical protein n=1 Tax=Paenibacillus sp. 1011MAR3C5 TaxID=1675787 RepID=UPI000E6C2BAB|nr:hypothetical protein [Paenibacillus sp. 1011MAR3C5]RJE91114.1 hypothetical protein D3P07_03325 [Paenibacillus sp. 1011MAR3C5]